MNRLLKFVRQERLYFLLVIFILLVNAIIVNLDGDSGKKARGAENRAGMTLSKEESAVTEAQELFMKRENMEKLLSENRNLAVMLGLTTLLMLAIFLAGLALDVILASFRMSKGPIDISTLPVSAAEWTLTDVGRVAALFLFFGHILIICESFLAPVFPALKDDNLRMMMNSSVLDIQALVFIIYFSVAGHGGTLRSLGLSLKNFSQNMFYGLAGYVAAVPALVAALALVIFIVNVTKYVPEKQPVVELFMKEKDMSFLFFSSMFAAVVGPAIEEVFFRGFMYKAFKKRVGIVWAALFTSVIFAALHTNVVGFLPILMLGFLLVYLYEKTGTLVAPMTVHIVHNLGMVFFVFLLKQLKG